MTTKTKKIIPVYIRLEDDLYKTIAKEADRQHRSVSGQCSFWLKEKAEEKATAETVKS